MKIKLLTRSSDLILLDKLNQMELTGETIDYKMPILPQITDAEVIVNGFGAIILNYSLLLIISVYHFYWLVVI
jgi:hypothetical protein